MSLSNIKVCLGFCCALSISACCLFAQEESPQGESGDASTLVTESQVTETQAADSSVIDFQDLTREWSLPIQLVSYDEPLIRPAKISKAVILIQEVDQEDLDELADLDDLDEPDDYEGIDPIKSIPKYSIELLGKPIQTVQVDIREDGERPEDESYEFLLDGNSGQYPRMLARTTVYWRAPEIKYQPLYFEDVLVERYGQTSNQVFQPYFSAAHFFISTALLPVNLLTDPLRSCDYPLGYCTPGNCTPSLFQNWFN